jgi:hypothetical protein
MTHQLNTLSNEIEILEHKKKELEKQVEGEHNRFTRGKQMKMKEIHNAVC